MYTERANLWSDTVDNVLTQNADLKDSDIELLKMLKSQVKLDVQAQNMTFYCSTPVIQKLLISYIAKITESLKTLMGEECTGLEIKQQQYDASALQEKPQNLAQMDEAPGSFVGQSPSADMIPQSHINVNKTFENYITDPENELVYNIAMRVANEPGGPSTNPFYLYGRSGVGKTHMLFAIANRLKATRPDVNLVFQRTEDFIRTFVLAMSRKNAFDYKQINFQKLFMSTDVIIVDDIQNFIKGPKARDAFFDIVSEFLEIPGRQLILASDVPPGNLKEFSPRLKSRFGSGVCREVFPPGIETRAAITLSKCQEIGVSLSDEIVDYIATHIGSNVRQIEGAIKTLSLLSQGQHGITLADAERALVSMIDLSPTAPTVDLIKERVANYYEVSVSAMESAERKKVISLARSMAMTLCHDLIPTLSLNDIGQSFNKDHSSVHEAVRRTHDRISNDRDMSEVYNGLTRALRRD